MSKTRLFRFLCVVFTLLLCLSLAPAALADAAPSESAANDVIDTLKHQGTDVPQIVKIIASACISLLLAMMIILRYLIRRSGTVTKSDRDSFTSKCDLLLSGCTPTLIRTERIYKPQSVIGSRGSDESGSDDSDSDDESSGFFWKVIGRK